MASTGRGWAVAARFAATALALSGCSNDGGSGGGEGNTLNMGVVPEESAEETLGSWEFFIEKFEEDTDYEIEFYEASDAAAVIEAAIAGDLDFVHLGPFAQWIARENGAALDTVGVQSPDELGPRNQAVAMVRADSGISDIAELEGEDVCFITPGSTTGYLFGAAAFLEEGIDPETDLNGIFVGDHPSAARTMYDGECAAVFTHRQMAELTFFEDNEDVDPEDVEIIWSEDVPEAGISVSTNLPEDVQDTVRETVLALNGNDIYDDDRCPEDRIVEGETRDYCEMLNDMWGMVDEEDPYWEPIGEVCRLTDAPACQEG